MQQGGSQYGVSPEMTPFTTTTTTTATTATRTHILGGGVSTSSADHIQLQSRQQKPGDVTAEAASPISSRPPAATLAHTSGSFEDLVGGPGSGGGFPDEDGLGGEETERGSTGGGNRWPRQETIALLKIRSEMDAAFRDATLKGPLWEDVSRKLAELGYIRSAKKCKEKFENVHKYYKRTKEGRAGRQDGKSYRFFTQLEALHTATTPTTATAITITTTTATPTSTAPPPITTTNQAAVAPVSMGTGMVGSSSASGRIQPSPTDSATPATRIGVPRSDFQTPPPQQQQPAAGISGSNAAAAATAGISFSNTSSSSADSESDDDDMEEGGGPPSSNTRKRKRGGGSSSSGGGSSSRKMMNFFEGLMKQVMEKQEAMQQRFLETIEKREQDRMIREEAWKRQEMARLTREHEMMAQERAISASRDAAVIAFLQKITGQTIQLPPPVVIPAAPPPPPPPQSIPPPTPPAPPPQQQQQQQQQTPTPPPPPQQHHHHHHQVVQHHPPPSQSREVIISTHHQPSSTDHVIVAVPEQQHPPQSEMGSGGFDSTSSRWPKPEVLALIKLRSGLESRYQEAGPKGPLWEEISAGMQRMGYNRSAKRCKEKWENINKYFKKVKESNKKRPEDAKTCPYFHQLDALYRKKLHGGSGGNQTKQEPQLQLESPTSAASIDNQTPTTTLQAIMAPPPPPPPPPPSAPTEVDTKNNNGGSTNNEADKKKPEDIVKELMEQRNHNQQVMNNNYHKMQEEPDSDNLDQDEEEDEDNDDELDEDDEDTTEEAEEEEDRKMNYKIEFQNRQNTGSASNGGGNPASTFLAMVQ